MNTYCFYIIWKKKHISEHTHNHRPVLKSRAPFFWFVRQATWAQWTSCLGFTIQLYKIQVGAWAGIRLLLPNASLPLQRDSDQALAKFKLNKVRKKPTRKLPCRIFFHCMRKLPVSMALVNLLFKSSYARQYSSFKFLFLFLKVFSLYYTYF